MSKSSPLSAAGARLGVRRQQGGDHQLGTALVLSTVWLVVILATGVVHPEFIRVETFTAISFTAVALLPLCVGLALVTISGSGLDLSVGVVSSLSTLFCAQLLTDGRSSLEVIVIVLLFGAAFGALNGILIAGLGFDPLVATLSTNFIGVGILGLQSVVLSMPAESDLRTFAYAKPLGVTNLLWVALAVLILVDIFLRQTRRGRHVIAVGGNVIAAERQGISARKVRFLVFVFSGGLAALSGLMLAASSDFVRAELTSGRAFQAISAVLLAGIMLSGGRGRLLTLIPSVLVIVSIPTALVTLGVRGAWSLVVLGAVLGVALLVDGIRSRRSVFS